MIIFQTFSDGDNSEMACPIYCNVFYSERIWWSIQNCSYVWQKKNTECNSVKGKFALIFCQAWVSVKTYLMKFCQTLVVTLTVCCSVKFCSHVWQNIFGVWQKSCQELGLFDRTSQKYLKIRKAYWSQT